MLELIKCLVKRISRQLNLMEVCGTHTAEIFRHGIRTVLPTEIKLLSGPGCPVCVTSVTDVNKAIAISKNDGVILTTFGDMMKVPGGKKTLFDARGEGANIRVVYSPAENLDIARLHQQKRVVFFSTGFETTIPSIAATIADAEESGIDNFYIYPANKIIPPALEFLLKSKITHIDGFLLPGHVSTITGSRIYDFIPTQYSKPCVITGFSSDDILTGIAMLLRQIYEERREVEIQYKSSVRKDGNKKALELLERYFEPVDSYWRGIGLIKGSGLSLRQDFNHRNADLVYPNGDKIMDEPEGCICGLVLSGVLTPPECSLFGIECTPARPIGACMVSDEGSCSIYYKYNIR